MTYPPGPRPVVPGVNLLRYRRDPLSTFTHLAREYGDISHLRLGAYDLVLLNAPAYIHDLLVTHHRNFHKGPALQNTKLVLGEGLLTSEGEFHLRQRRLAQPAFHRKRVEAYVAIMGEHAARMAETWRGSKTLDMSAEMSRLTLGIVGETLFGAQVEEDTEDVLRALTVVMSYFDLLLMPYARLVLRLPLPSTRRFYAAQKRLDQTIYRILEARRSGDAQHSDLVSTLLHAKEEGAGMTDRQLRDEALTIFLAGHETVANALTWTWYLLSQHPEVEEKLHAELASVLGGRPPEAGDISCLPFTRMVLSESMRLYPPAWGMGRRALGQYEVGGYCVPAGTVLVASQWVTHRDPRWFPEPERFDPERWTPEAEAARPRYAYFPFGGGPRQCIGEGFAWTEGIVLLATLAQNWRPRLQPGHPVHTKPQITLRPRYGMRMIVEDRRG